MVENVHQPAFRPAARCLGYVVALCLAGLSCSRPEIPRSASASSGPDTITTLGCLDGDPNNLRFEDETGVYMLMGDTASLAKHIGKAVAISGVRHVNWLESPGQAITVMSFEALAIPSARLHPVVGDSARWHNHLDRQHGISLAYPGAPASGANAIALLRPRLPIQDDVAVVHRSIIPRELYSGSNFTGGYFAVFVDPDITDRAQCAAPRRSRRGRAEAPNTLSIAGADYTGELESISASRATYRREYMHTFRNGMCYEFAFLFGVADHDGYGTLGCFTPAVDPRELPLLMLSEVSFFPPEVAPARPNRGRAQKAFSIR